MALLFPFTPGNGRPRLLQKNKDASQRGEWILLKGPQLSSVEFSFFSPLLSSEKLEDLERGAVSTRMLECVLQYVCVQRERDNICSLTMCLCVW